MHDDLHPLQRITGLVTEALLLADLNGLTDVGIPLDAALVALERDCQGRLIRVDESVTPPP